RTLSFPAGQSLTPCSALGAKCFRWCANWSGKKCWPAESASGFAELLSERGFRMFAQIDFYERAIRKNFELVEVSIIQRSAHQLAAQAAPSECIRHLGVDQADAVWSAMVAQGGCLLPQRDFELAIHLVMRDLIAVHEPSAR